MANQAFSTWAPTLAALDARQPEATETRTIGERLGDHFVNVFDYGVVGDGTTDDAAAIQAAFDWNVSETTAGQAEAVGQTVLTMSSVPAMVTELFNNGQTVFVINLSRPETLIIDTKVAGISGNNVTVTNAVVGRGIANGDTIRFSPQDRGTIFFPAPPEHYVTTVPIYLDGGTRARAGSHNISFRLMGVGDRTYIESDFDGFIFDRGASVYSVSGGTKVIENMKIRNTGDTGGAIRIGSGIGATVRECYIQAHKGVIMVMSGGGEYGATIGNGGTGYAVGDTFTVNGGTYSTPATAIVMAVSGGVVTEIEYLNPGEYTAWPTHSDGVATALTTTKTSGSGNDALTVHVQFKGAVQSAVLQNLYCQRGGNLTGSCAVCTGANSDVVALDAVSYERAVALYGVGGNVRACRLEVNSTACAIGVNDLGELLSIQGFTIQGGSMESNSTAIDIISAASFGYVGGFIILGNNGAAPGGTNPQYGIRVRPAKGTYITFTGMSVASNFDIAAVSVGNGNVTSGLTFIGIRAGNTTGTDSWALPTNAYTATFIECWDNKTTKWVSPVYTFANLPSGTNAAIGQEVNISNANTGTWGASVTTTGAFSVKVRYNGTNWTVVGI